MKWRLGYVFVISALLSGAILPAAFAQQQSGWISTGNSQFSPAAATSSVALPGPGTKVLVWNTGSNPANVAIGTAAVVATTNNAYLGAGACLYFQVNGSNNRIAAISTAGTTLNINTGEGAPPISCAGAGSSSGGAPSLGLSTGTAWTTATAGGTTQILYCGAASSQAYPAVITQLNQGSTISAGAVTFEVSNDTTTSNCSDGTWTTATVALLMNQNTFAPLTNAYTLVQSTNQPFLWTNTGYRALRLNLSTPITGSGTVTPYITRWPVMLTDPALQNPISGVSAVKIDQTTPGTTNAVQSIAGATGGATVSSAIAPATPAGVNLKASAGTLYSFQGTTVQATPVFVKFYNSASAPTCGSGTPVARFMIPAAATAANGAGTNITFPVGIAFGAGIGYCVTGALADNDTTAITATNTLVNIEWN